MTARDARTGASRCVVDPVGEMKGAVLDTAQLRLAPRGNEHFRHRGGSGSGPMGQGALPFGPAYALLAPEHDCEEPKPCR